MECSKCRALELIETSLTKLNAQLEEIIRVTVRRKLGSANGVFLDTQALMELPDHLRKTALYVRINGRARASDIAVHTKRARALESSYLNHLVAMKYLGKERRGRQVYYFPSTPDGVQ